jgi:hypothetical protein
MATWPMFRLMKKWHAKSFKSLWSTRCAGSTLRRNHFFKVRDAYFQRGLTNAVARGWIKRTRDRYKYELTEEGRAETLSSPASAARV